MSTAKTRATAASVDDYLASRASPEQLADCHTLMTMMQRLTGAPARLWGPSIVGFGAYHYPLASGKLGESCLTGFAVRGREVVVYLSAEGKDQPVLLPRLGKHKLGKGCLYFRRLADLDAQVLEQLIAGAVAELRRRHPGPASG